METEAERQSNVALPGAATTFRLMVAAAPYSILCALGFLIFLVPIDALIQGRLYFRVLAPSLFWSLNPPHADMIQAAAVFSAAFAGAYIMTARVLLRAVQNYELAPLTFLQVAAHMAVGILSGMLLFHLVDAAVPGHVLPLAGLAFACGFMPDFGLSAVFRRLRIKRLKQVDENAVALSFIAPLEMLDGIDNDIRYRLELAGFADVQNLAVANPLLIYVETPFSLYEAFDWVLQAQLCTAVGAKAFRELKSLGVRTSLDLERAVSADEAPESVIRAIGRVIFPSFVAGEGGTVTAKDIQHLAMVMLDDLHVHRLRHLWAHIFKEITGDEQRLWLYRKAPGLSSKPAQEPDIPDPPQASA